MTSFAPTFRRLALHLPRPWLRLRGAAAAPTTEVPWWVHVLWISILVLTDALQVWVGIKAKTPLPPWPQLLTKLALSDGLASLLFYANWILLIPRTLSQGRAGQFGLGVLQLLAMYTPLRLGLSFLLPSTTETTALDEHLLIYTVNCLFAGVATLFVGSGLKITVDYLQSQRNRRELERRQLLTELSMLKMQVNPHFLFNTLNNIYALASRKSDLAPEAVLRLSEIMRYMLYESNADTVPLAREMAHLRSFLDLQRLRLPADAPDAISFATAGVPADAPWPIAPMLLMPLVENAFKHGDLAARPRAVFIGLTADEAGNLRFVVHNFVAPAERELLDRPGGVGLTNLQRRLELLYPGRHTLAVEQRPGEYEAVLTLLPG